MAAPPANPTTQPHGKSLRGPFQQQQLTIDADQTVSRMAQHHVEAVAHRDGRVQSAPKRCADHKPQHRYIVFNPALLTKYPTTHKEVSV
jgi:hypothetical protein